MKPPRTVSWLSGLVAVTSSVAAATGLFRGGDGVPFSFTTVRGQAVEIYGQGLYRYDTLFKGGILRGTDAVTLLLAVPLLTVAIALSRRGSLRGCLLLTSTLAYFLYNAASLAFGVAHNPLFLLYIVNFSAALYAFILAFASLDTHALRAHLAPRLPHRAMATFLFLAGSVLFVWLIDIVGPMTEGRPPAGVASYTTEVTYVLDLGIIAPLAFSAGVLLLRRVPVGYALASILLVVNALIGAVVVAQTLGQRLSGVTLGVGQLVAFVCSFALMSLFALGLALKLFRALPAGAPGLQRPGA